MRKDKLFKKLAAITEGILKNEESLQKKANVLLQSFPEHRII